MAIFWKTAAVALVLAASGCATTNPMRPVSSEGTNSDAAWAEFDTNKDGYLSRDELEAAHAVGLLRDMRFADSDGDGKISRQEWDAWWPVMTKAEPAASLPALNASSAPTDGIRDY
jgi:hypothetical protein